MIKHYTILTAWWIDPLWFLASKMLRIQLICSKNLIVRAEKPLTILMNQNKHTHILWETSAKFYSKSVNKHMTNEKEHSLFWFHVQNWTLLYDENTANNSIWIFHDVTSTFPSQPTPLYCGEELISCGTTVGRNFKVSHCHDVVTVLLWQFEKMYTN